MAYVIAAPEMMEAASTDLANIASTVNAAHMASATPTVAVLPAAADEVSVGIAALFSAHAQDYQAQARKAGAASGQFVANLTGSAGAYASAESIATSLLTGLEKAYLALGNAVLFPLEWLIENQVPFFGQVALVALILLFIPYAASVIVLDTLIKTLLGQPI